MKQRTLWSSETAEPQRQKHFQRKEKVLGQYFTPEPLASWMVTVAASQLPFRGSALDPACGDGIFLKAFLDHGFTEIWGVDVDAGAISACRKAGITESGGHRIRLIRENALFLPRHLHNRFDLVATNPPFSAKYGRIGEPTILHLYALGRGRRSQAIEVLFLELCVSALRDDGMLCLVLPEGIFANLPLRSVREWLCHNVTPLAVVSLSRAFFNAKTCVLFARKGRSSPQTTVLLAHAETENDLRTISQQIGEGSGFRKPVADLIDNMSPIYHLLSSPWTCSFPLIPLRELISAMRGGRTEYGSRRQFANSGIPFLSAKTITPYGVDVQRDGRLIAINSPMCKQQCYARIGDVLFVRVGVGCIGRAAAILDEDEQGIADDYLYILRLKPILLPEFFAIFAQTEAFRRQIDSLKRGTGTVTLPQRLLREILVPIPPLPVQRRFAVAYQQIHRAYKSGQAQHDQLLSLVTELEQLLDGANGEPAHR
ncbi:MAG: N-6 DNA methylase [Armatimonadetes bacterium]|nr:N-6 DNA methylase [Armatimonadota bacterium]MDW8121918.1 N-6 DNA methylase [Armatimonadota bacterium]